MRLEIKQILKKIIVSNFIEINKKTFLDFKKDNQKHKEVFIKFKDEKDFQNHMSFINTEDKKLDFDNRTYEIKNWLDLIS